MEIMKNYDEKMKNGPAISMESLVLCNFRILGSRQYPELK